MKPHPFDDLRVMGAMQNYVHRKATDDFSVIKNPLYYVNFFQYRGGDLLRAILGRDVVYDREWEERAIQVLDGILQKKSHSCRVYKFIGARDVKIRGVLWKYNDWVPYLTGSAKVITYQPKATIVLKPGSKDLIWCRAYGDRMDVEGPMLLAGSVPRNGVLTLYCSTWNKRYSSLFQEVRIDDSERSTYQNELTPWRGEVSLSSKYYWWEPGDGLRKHKKDADELSSVSEADRGKAAQKNPESMLSVSSFVRRGLVSKPWRILKQFRGATVADYYRLTGGKIEGKDKGNPYTHRKKRAHSRKDFDPFLGNYLKPTEDLRADANDRSVVIEKAEPLRDFGEAKEPSKDPK